MNMLRRIFGLGKSNATPGTSPPYWRTWNLVVWWWFFRLVDWWILAHFMDSLTDTWFPAHFIDNCLLTHLASTDANTTPAIPPKSVRANGNGNGGTIASVNPPKPPVDTKHHSVASYSQEQLNAIKKIQKQVYISLYPLTRLLIYTLAHPFRFVKKQPLKRPLVITIGRYLLI